MSTACFSLAPVQVSDLPVVTRARTRLTGSGDKQRVLITGNQAISEPIFMISLRAGCGISLQRDFILMPQAPEQMAPHSAPAAPAMVAPSRSGRYREVPARHGETLEDIAAANAPEDLVEQRRLLAALRRANPEYHPEQMLDEGTPVKLPTRPRRIAAESIPEFAAEAPPPAKPARKRPASAPRQPAPNALANLSTGGRDRVAIGPDSDPLNDTPHAIAQREELQAMDERMLKMETALRTLNLQVDNLNNSIAVTEETIALRKKLQAAEATQGGGIANANAANLASARPIEESGEDSLTQWIELVFSALAGGGIVAGVAHYLSQRNEANIRRVPLANRTSQLPKRRRRGTTAAKASPAKPRS